jgi:hypothetical protein
MNQNPPCGHSSHTAPESPGQRTQHPNSSPIRHPFCSVWRVRGSASAFARPQVDREGILKYSSSLALGLLVVLNLDAQVNTADIASAATTTEVITTNVAQAVTMVIIHNQPRVSTTAGSISPLSLGPGCATCPDSAVAWWRAEWNTSDYLCAHNVTFYNSAVYVQGQVPNTYAFGFTGSNFVGGANSGLIFPSWSFEAWVKPTATVSSQVWLIGQSYGRQLVLRPGVSGPKVCLAISTDPYNWEVLEGAEITLNEWSHVVGVCDPTSGYLYVYVNGSPNATPLSLACWDSGCSWTIGGADLCGYSGQFFTGALDEVTVYDAALTQAQVQALHSSTAGKCTPAANATRDLLLVYNNNPISSQSREVKDYYLAHRPMVAGANVLAINCPTDFTICPADFTAMVQTPLTSWLNARPTLRPKYIVLFLDVPSRVHDPAGTTYTSVSYLIHTMLAGYEPYVTHINMRDNDCYLNSTTNACKAYIDKLASFGSNYSPGKLIISPSAGGYNSNTNYILDNVRTSGYSCDAAHDYLIFDATVSNAISGLYAAGVPASAVLYTTGLEECSSVCAGAVLPPHITNAVNVAGYVSWGAHSTLCNQYSIATNSIGGLTWHGSSAWWIIETIESLNGVPGGGAGDFNMWFDHRGFGGGIYTDYQNTPVGAVTHVFEPGLGCVNDTYTYFNLWASGANFATCAWVSSRTVQFQAVGDPFVTR